MMRFSTIASAALLLVSGVAYGQDTPVAEEPETETGSGSSATDTPPSTASDATAPAAASDATAPAAASDATAPTAAGDATAPAVASDATAPAVASDATAPAVAGDATAPGDVGEKATPNTTDSSTSAGASDSAATSSSAASSAEPPAESMAPAVVAVAPTPIKRSAFYFGVGMGLGAASLSDEAIGGTPAAGTLSFRSGMAISNRYLVGPQITLMGQFNAWQEETVAGAMLSSVMLEGMIYPMVDLPLSVSLGAGWGSAVKMLRLSDTRKGNTSVSSQSGNGVAWMAAVEWDFFPGPGTNIGLQLRYDGTQSTALGVDSMGSLNVWMLFY